MSVLVNDLKLPRPIRDEFTDARFRTVQVFGIFKPHRTPNVFPYDVVMMRFHIVESGLLWILRACLEACLWAWLTHLSADGTRQGNTKQGQDCVGQKEDGHLISSRQPNTL